MGKEFLDEQATVVESEELLRSVGLITSEVLSLDCDLPVAHALERLDSAGLTSAPVVDDNHVLVGMVFLRTLARLREESEFEVEDVMNTDVATVLPHSPVAEVAQLMAKHGLDRMPVVAADGHLMGVVTAMDVVRWLASRVD